MAAHNKLLGYMSTNADALPPPESPSPHLQQQQQAERQAERQARAKKLRVPLKKQRSSSANTNGAHIPEPAHEQSNAIHGEHPIYSEYGQEQGQQEDRDKFDVSTIADDFEDTVSQEKFVNDQDMAEAQQMGGSGVKGEHDRDFGDDQIFQQAAQYHNGDAGNLRDTSFPGNDYMENAPAPRHSYKGIHQYGGGQGLQAQAIGESLYKTSQTPVPGMQPQPLQPPNPSPPKQKIAGRFNASKSNHANNALANRPKNGLQAVEASRKRAFDEGVFSPVPKDGKSYQVVESLENFIPRGIAPYSIPPLRNHSTQPPQIDGTSDGEEYSDESHINEQPALQSRPVNGLAAPNIYHQSGIFTLASVEPDYDDAMLRKMRYDQLRDESFEATPVAREQLSEPELSISEGTIQQRCSFHVEHLRTSDERIINKERAAMAEFFGNLSKDEWEEAGDWFLIKFAGTLQALKDARKQKRGVVAEFEKEIEKREKEVKSSLQAYHEDMDRMKRGAKGVIEGKTI